MISHKHKTIGLRGLIVFALTVTAISFSAYIVSTPENDAKAYPAGCVSQACREAADRADASALRARELASSAKTLENEVARLNSEISALEDEINMNQAIAADLSAQIVLNENKLHLQQSALAKLLVDLHFESDADTISLLASSSSLGDLAEKQTRQSTAQSQITASAEAVKKPERRVKRTKS